MSGLVGFVNPGRPPGTLLDRMAESINYRVDDRIDRWNDTRAYLARVHHGTTNPETQPLFNEDGSICVMMAGEIFDYEDERRRLLGRGHDLALKDNDAEFCLHLYEELGEKAFERLNGSFLIVLYDARSRRLVAANDRFSSYALFYHPFGEGLIFGTELHPLLEFEGVPRRLNLRTVFEFFNFQRTLGTGTYYEDVQILPPAAVLSLHDGRLSISPYWEMTYREERRPARYFVHELAGRLKRSVERRSRDGLRPGILLSGGLDSRAVLAAAERGMVAFTIASFRDRDFEVAEKLARAKGCEHVMLKPAPDHFVDTLDDAVEISDGMYSFHHAWSAGFIDRIRERCDVLFHGNPPELFFRGTSLPRGKELRLFGRTLIVPVLHRLSGGDLADAVIRKLKRSIYGLNPKQLFAESCAGPFEELLHDSVARLLEEAAGQVENIYDRFIWFDTRYTSRYSSYLIQLSIRAFMDERAALLFDNDLLDLHLRLPLKLRCGNRLWNQAVAELDPGIAAIPDANTGRSPFFPKGLNWTLTQLGYARRLVTRKLLGRATAAAPADTPGAWANYTEMSRTNERFRRILEETVEDPECLDPDIFDVKRIGEMLEEHASGRRTHTALLFLLLTFGRWFKKYGPHAC